MSVRTFQDYLRAKRSVDDRALDRGLLNAIQATLRGIARTREGPVRIVEVGAGIGTMIERFVEWDLLPTGRIEYTAIDLNGANLQALGPELSRWADGRELQVRGADPILIDSATRHVEVEPVEGDAQAILASSDRRWDLLIGAAVLDVLPVESLSTFCGVVDSGGLGYFPITFDGATRFRPAVPGDRAIERAYHAHMDEKPGGNSHAGGATVEWVREQPDRTLLAVGGSDWLVRPVGGAYPGDEAAFLRDVLDTVEGAVRETGRDTAEAVLDEWLRTRRRQLDRAELVYYTHQLDVLCRVDGP